MKVEQIGFARRLEVGNEREVKDYTKATRGMELPLTKHVLSGWGEFHELIFRHMFNLKCLLNMQVEMSSRKLTMRIWGLWETSGLGICTCLCRGGI